ncbi:MAG: SulP family inorganic anion transporter, partial [Verrucomicrobiales bacterium]
VAQHGVEYLFATVVLMGLIQIGVGLLRWGKFIRMVPHPVMLGFVNGLAIVIFLAQLGQFKVPDGSGGLTWMGGTDLYLMLGLVALTMAVIWLLPKVTRAFPAPLAGILAVSALVIGLDLDTRSVGDLASIAGGLPEFHIPMVPLTWDTFRIILPYAVVMAAVGLIESLLTLNLVADLTNTKGGASRECLAQGAANVVTGFFGGMGGCAMIGQSMININSGGRSRVSGISAALFLLAFILFAPGFIGIIPVASLVGVMFMVVIATFEWSSLRLLGKVPGTDIFVIFAVSAVTVLHDLAIAVAVGVLLSGIFHAWNRSKEISLKTTRTGDTRKDYSLEGMLFFGTIAEFKTLFTPAEDPDEVHLSFANSKVCDQSAIEAIHSLSEKYRKLGKKLIIHELDPACGKLLKKAGDLVEGEFYSRASGGGH